MASNPKNLTKFVRRLAGASTAADRAAGVAGAPKVTTSAELTHEIRRAREAIAAAERRATELDAEKILIDNVDEAERMDAEALRLRRLEVPRLRVHLAELERRQGDAAALERQRAFELHKYVRASIYKNQIVPALKQLREAQIKAIAAVQDARAELGDRLADQIPRIHFGGIPLPDLIDAWIKDMDRQMSPAARVPGRAPPPPAVRLYRGRDGYNVFGEPPAPPPAPTPTRVGAGPVFAYGALVSPPLESLGGSAPRLPDATGEVPEGCVRARVLRAGYTDTAGGLCHLGRIIDVPRAVASKAAENGAIEILSQKVEP
jgi:hypothetical protein